MASAARWEGGAPADPKPRVLTRRGFLHSPGAHPTMNATEINVGQVNGRECLLLYPRPLAAWTRLWSDLPVPMLPYGVRTVPLAQGRQQLELVVVEPGAVHWVDPEAKAQAPRAIWVRDALRRFWVPQVLVQQLSERMRNAIRLTRRKGEARV